MPGQCANLFASRRVPQLDRLISTARDHVLLVRRKDRRIDRRGMPHQRTRRGARLSPSETHTQTADHPRQRRREEDAHGKAALQVPSRFTLQAGTLGGRKAGRKKKTTRQPSHLATQADAKPAAAVRRSEKLLGIWQRYRQQFQTARSSASRLKLIDELFHQPYLPISSAKSVLNVTF